MKKYITVRERISRDLDFEETNKEYIPLDCKYYYSYQPFDCSPIAFSHQFAALLRLHIFILTIHLKPQLDVFP